MCFARIKTTPLNLSQSVKDLGFNETTAAEALKNAIENRKFEISLYWHRAAYFWVFIGLIWFTLGKVLSALEVIEKGFRFSGSQTFILFFISCVGFCLSFAWYLVNKGSKFWQENWELQIAYLEESIMGPSFGINLNKVAKTSSPNWVSNLLGAESYSVSKINQLISLSNLTLWGLLAFTIVLYTIFKACYSSSMVLGSHWILIVAFILSLFLTLVFTLTVSHSCRSHMGDCEVLYNEKSVPPPRKKIASKTKLICLLEFALCASRLEKHETSNYRLSTLM